MVNGKYLLPLPSNKSTLKLTEVKEVNEHAHGS